MEVPNRPNTSPFKLHKSASAPLRHSGAIRKVAKKNPMKENLLEGGNKAMGDQAEQKVSSEEEAAEDCVFKPATDSSEPAYTGSHRISVRLPSEDSFSEESFVSEEGLAEEAKRKKEEEAAAKERQAQRQWMAIEELVQSEKNYLRMLKICTVDIRNSLQNLQVR